MRGEYRGFPRLSPGRGWVDADKVGAVQSVPPLVPRRKNIALRSLGRVFPGARHTTDQIGPYTNWWSTQNQGAVNRRGPMLIAIGDSISIGIGASHPSKSFVGNVGRALSDRDGEEWRIVNLAIAGARIDDGLNRQLPIALDLMPSDLVICCIGTNDIVWTPAVASVRAGLRELAAALPATTVFGPVAGASGRARLSNRALRSAAQENGQLVADIWSTEGPKLRERMAPDRFHPNDLGYQLMANAVLDVLNRRS